MDTDRELSAADRVVRLLHDLNIERAHVVQGVAEAAAHPAAVASLALVTPPASASTPLRQLAAERALVVPPPIVHSDGGPLSRATPFVLAAHADATAVVLREYASALWTDTVADRADAVAAALLDHLAAAERRAPLPPLESVDDEGEADRVVRCTADHSVGGRATAHSISSINFGCWIAAGTGQGTGLGRSSRARCARPDGVPVRGRRCTEVFRACGALHCSQGCLDGAIGFLRASPPHGPSLQEHADQLQPVTCARRLQGRRSVDERDVARALSQAALAALAIVAYKQPVSRADIAHIRTTDSSGVTMRGWPAG